MKAKIVYLVIIAALLAVFVRAEALHRRYRAVLIDERMKFQIAAIKNRAQAFMEVNQQYTSKPPTEFISFIDRYELRIQVPDGALPEFLKWMRGTTWQAVSVDGWPSDHGCKMNLGYTEFSYRVFYNREPTDWK